MFRKRSRDSITLSDTSDTPSEPSKVQSEQRPMNRHKIHNISQSVPKGGTLDTKASRWAFCRFRHALHFPPVLKNYKAPVWRGSSRFAQQLFLLHILETEKVAKTYTPRQEMENASSDEARTKGAAMLMFFGFVWFSPDRKGAGLTLKPMFALCESFTSSFKFHALLSTQSQYSFGWHLSHSLSKNYIIPVCVLGLNICTVCALIGAIPGEILRYLWHILKNSALR